jgi:lipoprotein-anchoring transpeptidase ErfK/SrfK
MSVRNFRRVAVAALLVAMLPVLSPSVQAATTAPVPTNVAVKKALQQFGAPIGKADGVFDQKTRRGLCVWRELTQHRQTRGLPTDNERLMIISQPKQVIPSYMVAGLNINRTCQAMTWVVVNSTTHARQIKAVVPVSTGQKSFPTASGLFKIYFTVNRWQESTLYPGAMMYRPMYFHGGMAIHGSATDALVMTYPASHGCVRALHADMDRLWAAGVGRGTPVIVYGTYVY